MEKNIEVVNSTRENLLKVLQSTEYMGKEINTLTESIQQLSSGTQNVAAATEEQNSMVHSISNSTDALSQLANNVLYSLQ